jgi:hypothetical protein
MDTTSSNSKGVDYYPILGANLREKTAVNSGEWEILEIKSTWRWRASLDDWRNSKQAIRLAWFYMASHILLVQKNGMSCHIPIDVEAFQES